MDGRFPYVDPDDFEDDDKKRDPVTCEVEVTDPEVLGYLYGPDGERIATPLSRPIVPFGFVK